MRSSSIAPPWASWISRRMSVEKFFAEDASVRSNIALPVAWVGRAIYKPRCPFAGLETQVSEKGQLCLALAHRCLHDHQGRAADAGQQSVGGLLQRPRP